MITFIARFLRALFLVFILLVTTPTLLFLIKWYYENIFAKKTYIGVIEIPYKIEKSDEIISSAKALFSSSEIRGVVLKCNSIGGNEGACQSVYLDLLKLKKIYKKPLIAYTEKECLYGAYIISLAADTIVFSPGALVGYFGEFFKDNLEPDFSCLKEMKGIYEKQYLDLILNSKRKVSEDVLKNMKGKCINGENALRLGLIDYIGGSLEVESSLKLKTVIEGSIEEVHGSIIEHFIMYAVDLVHRIINNFKLK